MCSPNSLGEIFKKYVKPPTFRISCVLTPISLAPAFLEQIAQSHVYLTELNHARLWVRCCAKLAEYTVSKQEISFMKKTEYV